MKILRTMMMVVLVAIIAFGMSTSAHAAFKLRLTDLTTAATVTIPDADLDGFINYTGALGLWSVNVTTGISKPILGSPSVAVMDLNSVNVTSSGPTTLKIELTDTDFSLPPFPQYVLTTDLGGTTNGQFAQRKYYDIQNGEFSGALVQSYGPVGPGPFSTTMVTNVPAPPGGLFSMTDIVYIAHAREGQVTSFDVENQVTIPEPGTLILLGSGLLGVAGYSRFRFGKKKKEA